MPFTTESLHLNKGLLLTVQTQEHQSDVGQSLTKQINLLLDYLCPMKSQYDFCWAWKAGLVSWLG